MQSWDLNSNEIKITFLGGLGEIGMNCFALESKDDLVLVDCGVLFTDLQDFGIDLITPNFDYVLERQEKFRGYLVTHGHEDHIGSLPFAVQLGLTQPIYCTPFAKKLIEAKMIDFEINDLVEIKTFQFGGKIKIGCFEFESIPVNHSIPESSAFVIRTPGGKIFHTADFRFDSSPHIGQPLQETVLESIAKDGVDLLLSDSTGIENENGNISEKDVHDSLKSHLSNANGLSVVTLFSSNVARISQVIEISKSLGKKVAICGRGVETMAEHASSVGYINLNEFSSLKEIYDSPREEGVIIVTGSQGEHRAVLSRVALNEHPQIELIPGDQILLSARVIPGNEKNIGRMINRFFERGIEVHYQKSKKIHTSGHASKAELKKLIEALKPKRFVPVHGEYRFLVFHQKLAKQCGVKQTRVVKNGEQLLLGDDLFKVQPVFEDTKAFLDLAQEAYVTKRMFKDRRRLAEAGIVNVSLMVPKESRSIKDLKVQMYGVVDPDDDAQWVDETIGWIKDEVKNFYTDEQHEFSHLGLEEAIRVELRRRYKEELNRRPQVFVSCFQD